MLYKFLKLIVTIGLKLYYGQIKVSNAKELNSPGAKIIIANHPNTLMDAWMIGYASKKPIYYMAKGTFFTSRFKRKLLTSLGMIPINRSADGNTKGVSNVDSFEMCYRLLEEGKSLVIFPEGTSYSERLLRKLKSGSARIALQTELRNKGELGLKIIPVGLVYLEPAKFRSSVLINVGAPISPLKFLPQFQTDTLKAARQLTAVFKKELSQLLVGSETKEHETLADKIIGILVSSYSLDTPKGLEHDISFIKKVNEKVIDISRKAPESIKDLEQLVYQIEWQVEKLDVKSEFLDRKFRSGMFVRQILQSIIGLILGLPFFLWGMIHNAIPYYFADWVIPKIVKDIEYFAPLAVLLGLITYPLNYFGFVVLAHYAFGLDGWNQLFYFATMPISGLFAYYFYHYYKHITFKLSFTMLMKSEGDAVAALKKDRKELRDLILG